MAEPKLKPCPFCGKEAELDHNFYGDVIVRCSSFACKVNLYVSEPTLRAAVRRWNTRKEMP